MKVGDYVRIKNGDIGKIKENDGELIKYCVGTLYGIDLNKNRLDREVLKSSPNIIDLIEENDFINGLRVEKNKYGELYTSYVYYGGDIGKQCEVYTTWLKEYTEDMIENIVTHEQFESMQYNLESEVN